MAINSHEKNYKEFCTSLQADPSLTFSAYCRSVGANRCALYSWMKRRHISLKRLYRGVGRRIGKEENAALEISHAQDPAFMPVSVISAYNAPVRDGGIKGISISFKSGLIIRIEECSVHDLTVLLGGPAGTGHV